MKGTHGTFCECKECQLIKWDSEFKLVKIADIENLLRGILYTDGAHHKQWYLEEIGKLCGIDITQWKDVEDGQEWKRGIVP